MSKSVVVLLLLFALQVVLAAPEFDFDAVYDESIFDYDELEIVNGTNADFGEFPFIVALRLNNGLRCAGSILNADHILTAAHCVCSNNVPISVEGLTIQYGLLEIIANDTNSIPLQSIVCNNYDSSNMHIYDVAILTLNSSIPDPYVVPTILENRPCVTQYQIDATSIGWGRNFTGGYVQNTLQKVDVVIYNDTVCSQGFNGRLNVFHHVCAGWPENGRGSCQGDSGGPLVTNEGFQIGIVSFGASGNCGISNATYPKVLARVPSYISFIQEQAGEVSLATDYVDNAAAAAVPHVLLAVAVFVALFQKITV